MKIRPCPLCGSQAKKTLLYKKNFQSSQVNKKVFSARRLPDRLHYKTLKCLTCGLVYADSVLTAKKLSHLYQQSHFTYQDKISDLTKTYGYYLKQLELFKVKKKRLLEIGCANGFFLLEAKRQGYRQVWGIEPGKEAVSHAPKSLQPNIKNTVFKKKLFPANYFDVICFFQTFDHITNPNKFLRDCYQLLKPNGLILAINHNVDSLQAKILKEKSPIIDIEHPYLYSPQTMKLIFKKNKFEIIKVDSISNIYSLDYIVYLLPFPKKFKHLLIKLIKKLKFNQFKFKFKLGNLMLIAKKPQ